MSGQNLPSTSGPRHAIIAIMALGYGLFLAFVVFWPSPIDAPVQGLLERANSIGSTIGVLIAVVIRAVVKMRDEKVIERHEPLQRAAASF